MSELEQTIEELEAEVLAELEEAEDPTKKGAAPAEKSKMKIIDMFVVNNDAPESSFEDLEDEM